MLAKVNSTACNVSIPNLRNDNASLITKIDKLNASLSSLKIENEKLIAKAKDLNICNASISNLIDENTILHAKIVELNACKPSTSSVDHVLFVLDVEMLMLMLFMRRMNSWIPKRTS